VDDIGSRGHEHARHVVERHADAEAGGGLPRQVHVDIADRHHRCVRDSAQLLEMSVCNLPAPDQRNSQRI
jgi:hypothetical protein